MKGKQTSEKFRLIDQIIPDVGVHGSITGVLATSFDLNAEFFETDFLPSLLGLGAWNDRAWTTRIAMEKHLALMESMVVYMQPDRYQGRPRSLRVSLIPYVETGARVLHAKVLLVVYERAIRLILSSANLTPDGYRHNREVAVALFASERDIHHAAIIRSALQAMPEVLGARWGEDAEVVYRKALGLTDDWAVPEGTDDFFIWGGAEQPLHQQFLALWPEGEQIDRISIVSPFWSQAVENGPVGIFLKNIESTGALGVEAELNLYSEARLDAEGNYWPELTGEHARFDFRKLGVRARAWAVDPSVPVEDVGMRSDFTGRRRLHAKIVLMEGPDTTLAYVGSANFTAHGWGFLSRPESANIEAGVILRRTGAERQDLRQLLPPTAGVPIPLEGEPQVEKPAEEEPVSGDWPRFLQEAVLVPANEGEQRLVLRVVVDPEAIKGAWTLAIAGEPPHPLLSIADASAKKTEYRKDLEEQVLNVLLRQREIQVSWWASEHSVAFPVNVALEARTRLPISPGDHRPGEGMLLAYYQGRITFEDLFPPPVDDPDVVIDEDRPSADELERVVDTSGIQSYQIREFVEALTGIRQELKASAISEPAMRLALRGAVSPVALAQQIKAAVLKGERTAVGGAFELVELVACLLSAKCYEVPESLQAAWMREIDAALTEVESCLADVRKANGSKLGRRFKQYEMQLRRHLRTGEPRS